MMGYSTNRPFVKVDVTGEVDKRFGEVTSQLAETAWNNTLNYGRVRFRSDFNSQGIELVRGVDGKIQHNVDTNFNADNYQLTIYFDTNWGDDITGAGTVGSPYKTLGKSFKKASESASKKIKVVGKGKLFREESYSYDWFPNFINKTIYLVGANEDGTNLVISNAQSSERVGGYATTNYPLVWVSYNAIWKTSRSLTGNVVDLKNQDFYGIGKPLSNVSNLIDCESTLNSYYINGSDVYVNTFNSQKPDDNLLVCPYSTLFKLKLDNSRFIVENCDFYGGVNLQYDGTCHVDGDINSTFIAKNCRASGGNLTIIDSASSNYQTTTNAFGIRDVGLVMFFECKTGYVRRDGFNYHYYNTSATDVLDCLVFEYKCVGHETGYNEGSTNNQFSTMHEGANILRVDCVGHDTGGACIVDMGGSRSVLVDCHMGASKIQTASSLSTGYRFFSADSSGYAVLISCNANGSTWAITGSIDFPVTIKDGFKAIDKIKDVALTTEQEQTAT